MQMNEISVVAMRTVGRPQTAATLGCLYNCMHRWDRLLVLGKLDKGSTLILNELQRSRKVIWDATEGKSGEQAMRMMYHLRHLELRDDDIVLFLDDDILFNHKHVDLWIQEVVKYWVAVVAPLAFESDPRVDMKVMVKYPSFDLLCSAMRAKMIKRARGDELWFLGRLNYGGEFFFMNWMFKRLAKELGERKFITVVDSEKYWIRHPVHLWIKDVFKKPWQDKLADWWGDVYTAMMQAKDLKEMKECLTLLELYKEEDNGSSGD